MALISQIRKNSWILVVLIALGLIGFIVMDMTSGQQSLFGSSQLIMGEVDGRKLDWNQFNRTENLLYGNSGTDVYVRRNVLWNYFVEEAIVAEEAEELGLGVSKPELLDLQFGPNPSPVIQQRFRDPNTQVLDRQRLNEFKSAIETGQLTDPQLRAFWAHQEKEVIKERLQAKINALVTKAMYTPTWMAEMGYQARNQQIDLAYVQIPYDVVDNTEVSLSDSDFEAYLEENRALYENDEETRRLAYVIFNVQPTPEDSARWRNQIQELIPDFAAAENDSLFAATNYGIYDPAFVQKSQLSPEIADTVFSLPAGSVYGPYMEGNYYRAVKVIGKMIIPDSVRSRHILVPANDPVTLMQAQQRIDSLKNLIRTGQSTFDSLALQFGTDATRTEGGDLGFAAPGGMVKPFNDLIFYQAEPGELHTVITQFGVHLVEVTDRKFINNNQGVQLAFVQQAIVPSDETQNQLYDEALAFVGANRTLEELQNAASGNPGLSLETSSLLEKNDFTIGALGAGQSSRDMVRWAFTAKKGEVSPEVYTYQNPVDYYNEKYVVAALQDVQEEGLPSADAVRADLEPLVINKKKADIIRERIESDDLGAIAQNFSAQVDTLSGITFDQNPAPPIGSEPKVLGTAFSLEPGATSEPIAGNTGVFVIRVLNKPEAGAATNLPQLRRTMSASARAQVSIRLMQALVDKTEVEDNRSRFY